MRETGALSSHAKPRVPAHHQTFLAFDWGAKRTGVAVGSRILKSATPQPTIKAEGVLRMGAVAKQIALWQPDGIVVGLPLYPDGADNAVTGQVRRFANQIRGQFRLPVYEVDERYSSVEAQSLGAQDLDAGAACVILEQFLKELE